jgi:hypothetical protein
VGVDPGILVWEEPHWDGSLAVDMGIHPGFALDAPERAAFYSAPVRAVVAGRAMRLDNPRGGIAVLLHGTDGRTYYFAHLRESEIDSPRDVAAGETLGRIGNTGTWTQYLEPHLHFSIAEGHVTGLSWQADVSAAAWLRRAFSLAATPVVQAPLVADHPQGLPLFGAATAVTGYEEASRDNPLLAGITVNPAATAARVPVRATLTGLVRMHRDTPLGTRIQITNARGGWSVLISGAIEPIVRDGVVYREDIVGFATGPLHYMTFSGGRPVDPADPPGDQDP